MKKDFTWPDYLRYMLLYGQADYAARLRPVLDAYPGTYTERDALLHLENCVDRMKETIVEYRKDQGWPYEL